MSGFEIGPLPNPRSRPGGAQLPRPAPPFLLSPPFQFLSLPHFPPRPPGLPAELEFPLRLGGLPEGLLQYLALLEARPRVAQVRAGPPPG